jgi:hypothetical protein
MTCCFNVYIFPYVKIPECKNRCFTHDSPILKKLREPHGILTHDFHRNISPLFHKETLRKPHVTLRMVTMRLLFYKCYVETLQCESHGETDSFPKMGDKWPSLGSMLSPVRILQTSVIPSCSLLARDCILVLPLTLSVFSSF